MFEKNIFEYIEPNKIGKFELRDSKMRISKKENPNRYISCWTEYEAKNNMRLL